MPAKKKTTKKEQAKPRTKPKAETKKQEPEEDGHERHLRVDLGVISRRCTRLIVDLRETGLDPCGRATVPPEDDLLHIEVMVSAVILDPQHGARTTRRRCYGSCPCAIELTCARSLRRDQLHNSLCRQAVIARDTGLVALSACAVLYDCH